MFNTRNKKNGDQHSYLHRGLYYTNRLVMPPSSSISATIEFRMAMPPSSIFLASAPLFLFNKRSSSEDGGAPLFLNGLAGWVLAS